MLSIATSAVPGATVNQGTDLGALIGSRICHDLISPLGAIGNGVELIALSGLEATPEMVLIAESVENANARIRFFRIAFGAAGAEQTVGAQEIAAIIEALGRTGRHRIEWMAGSAPRVEVKLAFLVILCISSALPWGGAITIRRTEDGWRIMGAAERMKVERSIWMALCDHALPLEVTSAEVEFALSRDAAVRLGRNLLVQTGVNEITVSF